LFGIWRVPNIQPDPHLNNSTPSER